MNDEVRRLRAVVERLTRALEELRVLDDPTVTRVVQDLERVRAESIARLAELGAGAEPA
jgi:hypothetical protein